MKISREKPCQRRHHRITTPLSIKIDGESYSVADWSLSGFKINGCIRPDLVQDKEFSFYFSLPFQGFDIAFQGTAKVVRIFQQDNQVAAQFCDLGERQQELLSHFMEELIRGSMTSVADTIFRIDSPVTPVSTEPDPSPQDELPAKRWQSKFVIMSSLYFSVGLALFVYIIFTLYANFFSLEVDSGVVSAPIERIYSTTNGRIELVHNPLDTLVKKGASLIRISDAKIEELISLARIRIKRGRSSLETKETELVLEKDKLADYRIYVKKSLNQAKIEVNNLTKQQKLSGSDLKRFDHLTKTGAASIKQLDDVKRFHENISYQLKISKINLQKQYDTLKSIQKGRYFTGEKFEGLVSELESEVNRLRQEVVHSKQELNALYQRRNRLTLYASHPGRLIQLTKSIGSSTKRGEVIALFEHDKERVLHAYLTQQEVLEIEMHHAARVYFPSLDQVVQAKVISIDRTEGFLFEKESRYSWRANDDRTARVTLAFVDIDKDKIRQSFKPGLPAMVIFPNHVSKTLGNFFRSFKSQTKNIEPLQENQPNQQENQQPAQEDDSVDDLYYPLGRMPHVISV